MADSNEVISRPDRSGAAAVSYGRAASILTPASGFVRGYDFTLNPYSGCAFGCSYCYARFFAPDEALASSWGEWVRVKTNARALLRKARESRGTRRLGPGASIYMSSVTDPYQPIEKRLGITRSLLKELIAVQPRLTIQTRSPLVTRDLDLLTQFSRIRVNFTVPTDSERVRKRYEPRCPSIEARLEAAERVAATGVPVGISVSPMLPIIDAEAFGARIARAGASGCVTQYAKQGSVRFAAGSPANVMAMLREDGWTVERYVEAGNTIARVLHARGLCLVEGVKGYAPVQ